jgi:YihY family inner membrane protein
VVYKFGDDQGNYLTALITYYAFLSIFPLLLLGSSILGFVLQGNHELQKHILDSTLARFPVIGQDLRSPGSLKGSTLAVVVGALGSLYGALGVANAVQNALNTAWAVPRNRRPNPIMGRLRSLLLLAFSGLAILLTTLIANAGTGVSALGANLRPWASVLILVATVLINGSIFTVLFWLASAHEHPLRQDLPGGIFVAVMWQLLQLVGTAYVSSIIHDSSANASSTNDVFAVVLGMLAWIYLGGLAVMLAIEINVVLARTLYPRALLTPFTDNVDLTEADRAVYTGYAQAQGHKGFQSVDVTFDESPRERRREEKARAKSAKRGKEARQRAEERESVDGDALP